MVLAVSLIAVKPSRADAEHEADGDADDLIGEQEKNRGDRTMTNTMMVVTVVSLRVGQVTFCASARTSCRNLNGLIFGILRLSVLALIYPLPPARVARRGPAAARQMAIFPCRSDQPATRRPGGKTRSDKTFLCVSPCLATIRPPGGRAQGSEIRSSTVAVKGRRKSEVGNRKSQTRSRISDF